MKILSLFDGMSCGMIAMKNSGVDIERYDAYEIDKYAINSATYNFPEINEHGDVFSGDFTKYNYYDFLIGGSPCTYWSIAQATNRREKMASGIGWELFSQYVRALKESNPRYFIYENNKSMSDNIRNSITEEFGFEPVSINSALVSAQNRQRLYWVGRRNDDGIYQRVEVEQPIDRNIVLADVLDECYKGICQNNDVVQPCCVAQRGRYIDSGKTEQHFEVRSGQKTNALTTVQKDNNVCVPIRVGSMPRPNGELSSSQGFRIYDPNGKGVTLKGNAGGAGGKTGLWAIHIDSDKSATGTNTIKDTDVYEVKGGQIAVRGRMYPIKLADGMYVIRKLSITECKRLQTVPDWYEFPVSDAQAYKQLGNGWTCDVITHIIKSCINKEID